MAERVKASFVEPMLLLRSEELPDDDAWLKELKLDGYRALAIKTGGNVQLRSRNDNDFTGRLCAAGIVTLNVACICCSRRGRYKVTRLIDQHGASMNLALLRDVLSKDCPRRLGSAMNPCGACFPDRVAIEKAMESDRREY